jgi:hypothetical protein
MKLEINLPSSVQVQEQQCLLRYHKKSPKRIWEPALLLLRSRRRRASIENQWLGFTTKALEKARLSSVAWAQGI